MHMPGVCRHAERADLDNEKPAGSAGPRSFGPAVSEYFDADLRGPRMDHIELFRCRLGKVDNSALDKRAPVVNTDNYGTAIP